MASKVESFFAEVGITRKYASELDLTLVSSQNAKASNKNGAAAAMNGEAMKRTRKIRHIGHAHFFAAILSITQREDDPSG